MGLASRWFGSTAIGRLAGLWWQGAHEEDEEDEDGGRERAGRRGIRLGRLCYQMK
jgi:hypothetical protein